MRIPLYQIDAFTDTAFKGNPAAVCLLPGAVADPVLQAIAAEMALSETAFLLRTDDGPWETGATFSLRWFTPQTEVPLCGHATLASAATLFDAVKVATPVLTFRTLSGDLYARHGAEGITLDFPVDRPAPCDVPDDIVGALGVPRTAVVSAAYGQTTRKLLLHVQEDAIVRDLSPDFIALVNAPSMVAYRGLIVTASGTLPYDFVSRFFAPWIGINEDPVTGSAHTVLTPYWAERTGKRTLIAYQASARGGELRVSLRDDARVDITGRAVLVAEGQLILPSG